MDADSIKRWTLYVIVVGLGCVLAWKVGPPGSASGAAKQAAPVAAKAAPGPNAPPGSVLVTVSMVGFDPDVIEATAGRPLKLAFFRPNDANCAREVVFPDLGIEKELPPGQTTVVDVTPTRTGPLVFECGMKMLKGKLIVR